MSSDKTERVDPEELLQISAIATTDRLLSSQTTDYLDLAAAELRSLQAMERWVRKHIRTIDGFDADGMKEARVVLDIRRSRELRAALARLEKLEASDE